MARKTPSAGTILGWGAMAAVAVGFVGWLATGRDPIEEQIDRVVTALNARFGKTWRTLALSALKSGLGTTLAGSLVTLIGIVHAIEQQAEEQGWDGAEKRRRAVAAVAR